MSGAGPAGGLVCDRYRVARGCLDCAGDLAGALGGLPGAQQVQVLGAAGVVVIGHDGGVTPDLVARQVAQLGLELSPAAQPTRPAGRGRWWRSPRVLLLAVAELLLDAGLAADHLAHQHAGATGLYLATVAVGGIFPVQTAWRVLMRHRLSIGALLVAGTIGALALGVFAEAAMLVVVFSVGGLMEDYVADRARSSIRALMSLTPPVATRLQPDGTTAKIRVADLEPGELVLVRPGTEDTLALGALGPRIPPERPMVSPMIRCTRRAGSTRRSLTARTLLGVSDNYPVADILEWITGDVPLITARAGTRPARRRAQPPHAGETPHWSASRRQRCCACSRTR